MSRTALVVTLAALIIVPFGWWTLSPLVTDEVVDEEFAYDATVTSEAPDESEVPQHTAKVLATGSFVGADRIHNGTGTARIIETESETVLRLEDFEVTNGPDLYVLLSESAAPTDHESLGEYVELAELKGNIGNQTYTLPEGIDPARYQSVVVYCKAFSVVFATATLSR